MKCDSTADCRIESSKIRFGDNEMEVSTRSGTVALPVTPLPAPYLEWFERGRTEMYRALGERERTPGFFAHHLPVIATQGGDAPFAANLGHKGVGPLPRREHLQRYLDRYREALEQSRNLEPRQRLRVRVAAVGALAGDREAIDPRCLGTLEIFRKQAFDNLAAHPFASLLFTGAGPGYKSFQLDCAVEVLGPGDARYDFLVLARSMFEREEFHITQPGFACGYVFWISEIRDKTPYPVGGHRA